MTELEVKPKFGEGTPIIGDIEGTALQVYNFHDHWFPVGDGRSLKIINEIQHNREEIRQNMIITVGRPGTGKSYFALRLAQLFDPYFNPTIQVVFERSRFLHLIGPDSPLKQGQVIVADESHFILGARNWQLDIQKDLLDNVEAVRSAGYIIIIVALHLRLLDVIIREHVLNMMMDMEDIGIARAYRLTFPTFAKEMQKRRLGRLKLPLPDAEYCAGLNCLKCDYLYKKQPTCYTCRAVYERMKKKFLGERNAEAQEKSASREHKHDINYDDYLEKVIAHEKELDFNKNGKLIPESISVIMQDKYHESIPKSLATSIAFRGAKKYPSIFTKPIEAKKE